MGLANAVLNANQKALGATSVSGLTPDNVPIGIYGHPTVGGWGSTRPRLLVFGCSIAAQSGISISGGGVSAGATFIRSGSTVFTASAAQTLSDGAKLAIPSYYGETFKSTVSGTVSASTIVPVRSPLPYGVRPGAIATLYTTNEPANIRQNFGPISCALAMLGMPVEICNPTYGYGGSRMDEMIYDLPMMLARVRPQYVAMHLFENDVDQVGTTGFTWDKLVYLARAAVKMVVNAGAIPIVCSSVPSAVFNTPAKIAAFDAQSAWVRNSLKNEFPTAIPVDLSTPWLDTTQSTSRPPIAGVASDGIHPDQGKRFFVGSYVKAQIQEAMSRLPPPTRIPLNLETFGLSGSGGSFGGAGWVGGSVIPAGWAITADAGVTVQTSRNGDGSLKMAASVPGASNISGTRIYFSVTVPLQNAAGSNNAMRAWTKFKLNNQFGLSLCYTSMTFSGGETYSGGQNETGLLSDGACVGQTITIETPAVRVPDGATTVQVQFWLRPQTLTSPSGVNWDIDFYEIGIEPAAVY